MFRRPFLVAGLLSLSCVASLLFVPSRAASQDLIGIYLTWKQDPCTTMTINWVDIYEHSPTHLWYRATDTEEWTSAAASRSSVGPSTLQLRRCELTGLRPDTLYEFGLGKVPAKTSDGWRFRTMPAQLTRSVRFVSGGDMMHSRAMVDTMNRQVGKLDPDFALLGGDLAYENGVTATRWIDWLQSWTTLCVGRDRRLIPMVVTIGNHEVRGGSNGRVPDDAPYFYSLFSLPEDRSYYGLDFGRYLSLIVLDSGHTQKVGGPQASWLGPALASRAEQTFLFACYHYPAYGTTKAPKGGLPIDAPRSVEIREHWVPHFERQGLTAVFENDHHNYKRSHRIRAHRRDDQYGVLYLGDGAWGVKTREVPKPEVAWWLAKAEPRNHLWHVELHPARTARIQAVDDQGKVFDEVLLEAPRSPPAPAAPVAP
ncbi:MAG: fibronectin type III domain-containing protein [Pirellulales bacterium]